MNPRVLRAIILAGLACVAALAGIAFVAWRVPGYLEKRIVRELDQRFGAHSRLASVRVTLFPRLSVSGENLVIRRAGAADFITIPHFEVRAGLWGLLRRPVRVEEVRLRGLEITIPAHGRKPKLQPASEAGPPQGFVIGRVVCDDAHLTILTDSPGKAPLRFDIFSVVLAAAAPYRAMPFTARLENPKPAGYIDAKGDFGPWDVGEPRDTPVSGAYTFDHADLGTLHGIGGILSSKGRFQGVLSRIDVDGTTDTPDFRVSTGDHSMPLHTDFSATVDGTDGNTYLHPVRATLLHSLLIANGSVVRRNGGHEIRLNVVSGPARVEDLLKIALRTNPPALSGPATLHAEFLLPSGTQAIPDRLELNGSFSLPAAHFSERAAQVKLDQLSLRALGHPKAAQLAAKQPAASNVVSNMRGDFKLRNGVVSLSNLQFAVPGAAVRLAGDYRLEDRRFLLTGQARLEAKLSQMTTGVRSFLLKLIDPFFEKGAGTVLPVRITGIGTSPTVTLNLGQPRRAQ